jgi:hypothetical protein
MWDMTYNIQCIPSIEFKPFPGENLYIMIKRNLHDLKISDVRQYLRKLILLSNKQHMPMLYYDKDLSKQQLNVTYMVYQMKKDSYCKYVTIKITAQRPDYNSQEVKVQILDFVSSALPHERSISVSKLDILGELNIRLPI